MDSEGGGDWNMSGALLAVCGLNSIKLPVATPP